MSFVVGARERGGIGLGNAMWSGLVGWCMFWLGWVWLGRVWSGWVGSGMVGSVRPAKSVEADRMMGKHGRERHGNDVSSWRHE